MTLFVDRTVQGRPLLLKMRTDRFAVRGTAYALLFPDKAELLDLRDKFRLVDRLGEISLAPFPERAEKVFGIGMGGGHDDLDAPAERRSKFLLATAHFLQDRMTIHPRHVDIETKKVVRFALRERSLDRRDRFFSVDGDIAIAVCRENLLHQAPAREIIIDNQAFQTADSLSMRERQLSSYAHFDDTEVGISNASFCARMFDFESAPTAKFYVDSVHSLFKINPLETPCN